MECIRTISNDWQGRGYKIRRVSDSFYLQSGSTFSATNPSLTYMNPVGTGCLGNAYKANIDTSSWSSGVYSAMIYASGTSLFLNTISFTI